jgi:hypothetical protein
MGSVPVRTWSCTLGYYLNVSDGVVDPGSFPARLTVVYLLLPTFGGLRGVRRRLFALRAGVAHDNHTDAANPTTTSLGTSIFGAGISSTVTLYGS